MMRATPKQYAAALLAAVREKGSDEKKRALRRFPELVSKRGDSARLEAILREIEKQYLKGEKLRKVVAEVATPQDKELKAKVRKILGKDIFFQEKVRPEVLAGIKILVDDEILIDATGKRAVSSLFRS